MIFRQLDLKIYPMRIREARLDAGSSCKFCSLVGLSPLSVRDVIPLLASRSSASVFTTGPEVPFDASWVFEYLVLVHSGSGAVGVVR